MRSMRALVLLLSLAVLGGCLGEPAAPSTSTPTATTPTPTPTPPASTPTATTQPDATPTPATTPATPRPTPTPPPQPDGVTSVALTSGLPRGVPGQKAMACVKVEGKGVAPHVAVHVDDESHPDAAGLTFAAYHGITVYPRNETSADPAGYALPFAFCVGVPIPAEGRAYYRAHAIGADGAQVLSAEASTSPAGTATSVSFTSFSQFAAPGAPTTVCWRVSGSGNVAHTAVHWDNETHFQAGARFSDYDKGASYPGNATAAAPGGYDLPGDYCAAVPVPLAGELYMRAHVIDSKGAPGMLSNEEDVRRQG